jgi:hypothetical protein
LPKLSNHRYYRNVVPYHDELTSYWNKSTALTAAHYTVLELNTEAVVYIVCLADFFGDFSEITDNGNPPLIKKRCPCREPSFFCPHLICSHNTAAAVVAGAEAAGAEAAGAAAAVVAVMILVLISAVSDFSARATATFKSSAATVRVYVVAELSVLWLFLSIQASLLLLACSLYLLMGSREGERGGGRERGNIESCNTRSKKTCPTNRKNFPFNHLWNARLSGILASSSLVPE